MAVVAVLHAALGGAGPASADGPAVGADIHLAQTMAGRDLTVIVRRTDRPPAPLRVDVVTHAGSPAGRLALRASTAGETVSSTTIDLGASPGFHAATLRVDRTGPWELALDDGTQVATIPFVVPAAVRPPWENAVYGGFVVAGALLLIALGLAAFGRVGAALAPAGGTVAGLAVAVTAAVLSSTIVPPSPPGTLLDPTVANVNDPYRQPPSVDFSRPPVNLTTRTAGRDLHLRLTDGATGRPVDDLLVHHHAFLHLVVVSPSGGMRHLHPVRVAPGDYRARLDPSEAGVHAVTAELARRGGGVQHVRSAVHVSAHPSAVRTGAAQAGSAGCRRIATASATTASASCTLSKEIRPAGTASTITADFGSPTLQPWLGMLGHMIVVGPVDGTTTPVTAPIWAHVHAMLPQPSAARDAPDESIASFGPQIRFTYTFPLPGRYLAWVQAARGYSVITVPTVVEVPAAGGGQG
ncbi:hypothetical protein ACQEVC_04950 [Plantactinospora sp. CA-294935]|uniref:hypothetical protein n=1 Tax=Plantactinospora sp. CA-294935 TaxID=3240012 RepID=UPI003D919FD0